MTAHRLAHGASEPPPAARRCAARGPTPPGPHHGAPLCPPAILSRRFAPAGVGRCGRSGGCAPGGAAPQARALAAAGPLAALARAALARRRPSRQPRCASAAAGPAGCRFGKGQALVARPHRRADSSIGLLRPGRRCPRGRARACAHAAAAAAAPCCGPWHPGHARQAPFSTGHLRLGTAIRGRCCACTSAARRCPAQSQQ
jgi:hypothetical protein